MIETTAPMSIYYRTTALSHGFVPSTDERRALADCVKAGDSVAREQMILSFLRYCESQAWHFASLYKFARPRIEYPDLAQLGMLKVVEALDQAIAKYPDPYPYIFVAVRNEMNEYCLYHCSLVRTPETRTKDGGAAHDPIAVSTIDVMANEEESVAETIPEPARQIDQERDFSGLYGAVEKLKGRYRETIERHYGLNGYAPESLPSISRAITNGSSATMAGSYRALALKKLKRMLESA